MPGQRRPIVVGVTGGIASGKSTVTKICQSLGANVIDADKLGHRSYEPYTDCYKKLVEAFGPGIVGEDGTINRRALGAIVFSSKDEMHKLEGIVWPEIKRLIDVDLVALKETGASAAVVEAAVMLEAGWESFMDEVWVVAVDPEVARKRLMARNGYSAEEADKRIRAQMSNEERIAKADRVIWNNGTQEELETVVSEAWKDRGTLRALKLSIRARRKIMIALTAFLALGALALRSSKGRWR